MREIQGRIRGAVNRNQNQKQTKADKGQAGLKIKSNQIKRLLGSLNLKISRTRNSAIGKSLSDTE